MLLITENLLTSGQLSGHGTEVRYSLQLGKYVPIPMVLILSSVMLLITEILSTIGQLSVHGIEVRYSLQLGNWASSNIRSASTRYKTCLQVFRKSETQTRLLSYWDKLDICNFACSKFRYDTLYKANNKGADQPGPLLFTNPRRHVFSSRGPGANWYVRTASIQTSR